MLLTYIFCEKLNDILCLETLLQENCKYKSK